MRKKHLKMIQSEPCNWYITNDKGTIIQDDIKVGLLLEAEDYIKRYISSFNAWTYELIPLGRKDEERND